MKTAIKLRPVNVITRELLLWIVQETIKNK